MPEDSALPPVPLLLEQGAVDFQNADFGMGEHAVGGETASEIVQGTGETVFPKFVDHLRHPLHLVEHDALQQLELNTVCRGIVFLMDLPVLFEKVEVVEHGGGEVHADLDLFSIGLNPAVDGGAHLCEYAEVRQVDDAVALQDGQEFRHRDHAADRVFPAHESLCGADLPGAQVHLGLQVKFDMALFDGGPHQLAEIVIAQLGVLDGQAVHLEMGIPEIPFRAFDAGQVRVVLGGEKIHPLLQGIDAKAAVHLAGEPGVVHVPDAGVDVDHTLEHGLVIPGEPEQDVEVIQAQPENTVSVSQPAGDDLENLGHQLVPCPPAVEPVKDGETLDFEADQGVLPALLRGKGVVPLP